MDPGGRPRVAVVIVSYNTVDLTLQAVGSASASSGVDVETWVVDNASSDGSADAVRERFPEARVLALEENLGFGRGNNAAFERVEAPFVLLLNSDATFRDLNGLRRLVAVLQAEEGVGLVGPRLESPQGDLEYSARSFPGVVPELIRRLGLHRLLPEAVRARTLGTEFYDHGRGGDVDWITGACILIRSDVLREVGGFDPQIFLYGEELEWCWRVREAGWRIVFEPGVTVIHQRGASGQEVPTWRTRLAMAGDAYAVRKHKGYFYLAAFFVARCVGLAAEALIQGLLGLVPGQAPRRARAAHAVRSLAGWVYAVARRGAVRPHGVVSPGRAA